MAVGSQQYAITSTASIVASVPAGDVPTGPAGTVWLLADASNDVFIGGKGVTSSNGFKILHTITSPIGPFTLFAGDVLYAVTASTATLTVLQT